MNDDPYGLKDFERAEERRYEDKQHRRETWGVTIFGVTATLVIGALLLLMMVKCGGAVLENDRWKREQQQRCLEQHGSWEFRDGCQFEEKK